MFDSLEYRLRDNNRDNTFVYYLSHKGYASYSEIEGGGDNFHGVDHGDDLLYLFPPPSCVSELHSSFPTPDDEKLRKTMIKLWVNFARTG